MECSTLGRFFLFHFFCRLMLQKDSMRHAGFPGFPRRFPAVSLQVSQGFFLRANLVSFFPCAKNIAFRGLTASKKMLPRPTEKEIPKLIKHQNVRKSMVPAALFTCCSAALLLCSPAALLPCCMLPCCPAPLLPCCPAGVHSTRWGQGPSYSIYPLVSREWCCSHTEIGEYCV